MICSPLQRMRRQGFEPAEQGEAPLSRLANRRLQSVSDEKSNTYRTDAENLASCLAFRRAESPDLALLLEHWDDLSEPVKAGILAMVKAAVER